MNLSDINSGPVAAKGFLNPICNDLNANSIETNTLTANSFNINKFVSSGNVRTINSSGGTTSLTPSDLISGVLGINVSGAGVVTVQFQLPTGASLDAALSSFSPPFYFTTSLSASFNVAITRGNINILLNSNISSYDLSNPISYDAYVNSAPLTDMNKFQRILVFARTLSGWVIYG